MFVVQNSLQLYKNGTEAYDGNLGSWNTILFLAW